MPTDEIIIGQIDADRYRERAKKKLCQIYNVIDWCAPAHVREIRNQSQEIRDQIRLAVQKKNNQATTVATTTREKNPSNSKNKKKKNYPNHKTSQIIL